MINLTKKQSFILTNLMILVAILIGITFVVACINMPMYQGTNELVRIAFSIIVVIVPLSFFTYVVVSDYKLKTQHNLI